MALMLFLGCKPVPNIPWVMVSTYASNVYRICVGYAQKALYLLWRRWRQRPSWFSSDYNTKTSFLFKPILRSLLKLAALSHPWNYLSSGAKREMGSSQESKTLYKIEGMVQVFSVTCNSECDMSPGGANINSWPYILTWSVLYFTQTAAHAKS